ncbi:hypothetical protein GCM10027275_33590 [Rhabdobacter roseus]|uniref:Uncharacterized protein n=1 Tax=Rhabdobacter roseus TaxID=1655419 RepID=A0A840TYZ6_9BACT|nr:hypothetical protein [Rhabdobacter roseus]MBB5285418.1 hypothetical protein [Rhabdobacter roseus]
MSTLPPTFYQTFFQYDTLFRVEEVPVPYQPEAVLVPEVPSPIKTSEPTPQVPTAPEAVALVDTATVDTAAVDTDIVGKAPQVLPVPVPATEVPAPLPSPEVPSPAFPALQHRVLVLVDEPQQPELLASEHALLTNILKAVGHSSAEADILNFSYLPTADARRVLSGKLTNHFITFGVPLIKLQLDLLLPPYTPKQVEGIWFLLADPLAVIEADKALKKRLWLALQKMFALS